MPDIGELIRQEKLREELQAAQQEEEQRNQAALQANPVGPSEVARALKPAVLPTLGQLGGTVAGMMAGPAAPVAIPTLEAAGGMLGEGLNQALGITEPSAAQVGLQGILPLGARALGPLSKILPASSKGATMLHEIAPDIARNRLTKMAPAEDAGSLFSMAEAQGDKIPTLKAQQTLKDSVTKYLAGGSASDQYKATRDYMAALGATLKRNQGALTPKKYQAELADLGTMLGKAKTQNEKAALMAVKSELESALNAAPQGSVLAQARQASLKEATLKELDDFTFNAETDVTGNAVRKFSPQNVLNKIRKDESFSRKFNKAFTPKERQEITSIYENMKDLPALPTTHGNTNNLLSDVFRGGRAGIAAGMLGASPEIASGIGLASTLTRPALDTAKVFKMAMTTPEGRAVLAKELTVRKNKPLREVMQKVATAISSTQDAQQTVRQEFGTTSAITPFPNER